MAITAISWSDGGFDLHLLVGEISAPLNARLEYTRKVGNAAATDHTASTAVAGVTVTFNAEFKPLGPQPANKRAGHGVEVHTGNGTVEIKSPLPARRLHNFLIRAEVRDADNSREIRIRVHVHVSIRRIWLTPRKLIVHRGTGNQQFTVLAQFDDDTNGDITGRAGLSFASSNNAVALAAASGKVQHVADGAARITVKFGPAPVSADLTDTADVSTRPSLATERRIERVRGRGPASFATKVNILFLPDGFLSTEKQQFNDIVDVIVQRLQTDVFAYPYMLLKDSINYWRTTDTDFLASEDENVSILSEASIVGRRSPQAGRMPFFQDPGARARWEVRHLVFKVGLPAPADSTKDRTAKLADWAVLYDGVVPARIRNDDFLAWRNLHTRKLLNERSTALGFGLDQHPRADLDGDRFLALDSRRVSAAQFQAMIEKLRTGAAPGVDVIGATWTTGKDAGLVCVLGRSARVGGSRAGSGFSTTLGRDTEHSAQLAVAPLRGMNLVKMELLRGGRLLPVHPMVSVNVAHECAHAFDLKDEYGGGFNFPAHAAAGIASKGNVQPESQIQTVPPQAPGYNGSLIKWNWPRLVAAGRLTGAPIPAGASFNVELAPGHRAQFALNDIVRLRKKDFVLVPPSSAFSGRFKIETLPAAPPNRVVIKPEAGTVITAADFNKGALVKPRTASAAVGVGADLPIIAPKVLAYIELKDLPLNRTAAACTAANDPTSEMTPVNLPAGLSPRRPTSKANIVGIYDGGAFFDCGVFHPAGICIMRTLQRTSARSARFCHVCRYMIVDHVDPTRHGDLDAVYDQFEYPEP